jgi:Icc-related predicted phosphoesterase
MKKNKTESNNTSNNQQQQQQQQQQRLGITIVCISDTHGEHRKLSMPTKGDILIHAGDYTKFGKKEQLVDFNDWLGTLPYKTKIVVNGNHECNAMWKHSAKSLLSNGHLLINESMEVEVDIDDDNDDENNDSNGSRMTVHVNGPNDKNMKKNKKQKLKIHGTNFYWPSTDDKNPYFDMIDSSTDIVIAHCPALGYLDNNGFGGCPALLHTIQERVRPKLVISGHIHSASGIAKDLEGSGVTFVNAANAKGGIHGGHSVGKQPIILTL